MMDADGTDVIQLTPWGSAFGEYAWSPDGKWIAFVRPYGKLFLVHPDGSGLHTVPLQIPEGTGAQNPSWSPDGTLIVFSLQRADAAEIYVVRPDGSGLRRVTAAAGAQAESPDWGLQSQ